MMAFLIGIWTLAAAGFLAQRGSFAGPVGHRLVAVVASGLALTIWLLLDSVAGPVATFAAAAETVLLAWAAIPYEAERAEDRRKRREAVLRGIAEKGWVAVVDGIQISPPPVGPMAEDKIKGH